MVRSTRIKSVLVNKNGAVINGEQHVGRVAFMTTLSGYVHYKLTGEKVIGMGDASGMFPLKKGNFD